MMLMVMFLLILVLLQAAKVKNCSFLEENYVAHLQFLFFADNMALASPDALASALLL